ncbi:MAG: hypothetical protein HRU01_28930 [Myxococcales bacterium]|nr:hypothetical protein [Myxococcales bacterium]
MGLTGFGAAEPAGPATATVEQLVAGAFCACGCGSHLPGGPHSPACFGCSVGKADLAFIRESLAAGRTPREILRQLADPILVEVFADYDDERLPAIWERARRVAGALRHHRVVLRTQARSAGARRAVALAECARAEGSFASMQRALIHHRGPWDEDALLRLAEREGLRTASSLESESLDSMRSCLAAVDVQLQIDKDRNHAGVRGVGDRLALFVNREPVDDSDAALRRAIESAIRAGSV